MFRQGIAFDSETIFTSSMIVGVVQASRQGQLLYTFAIAAQRWRIPVAYRTVHRHATAFSRGFLQSGCRSSFLWTWEAGKEAYSEVQAVSCLLLLLLPRSFCGQITAT